MISRSPALSSGENNFSFPVTATGAPTTTYAFRLFRSPQDTQTRNKLLERIRLSAAPSGFEMRLKQADGASPDDTEGFNSFVFNYTAAALPDTTAVNVTAVALHNSSYPARRPPPRFCLAASVPRPSSWCFLLSRPAASLAQVGVLCPDATSLALLSTPDGSLLCPVKPGRSVLLVGQANASAFLRNNETYAVLVSVPRPARDAEVAALNLTHFSASGSFAPYAVEMHSPLVRRPNRRIF